MSSAVGFCVIWMVITSASTQQMPMKRSVDGYAYPAPFQKQIIPTESVKINYDERQKTQNHTHQLKSSVQADTSDNNIGLVEHVHKWDEHNNVREVAHDHVQEWDDHHYVRLLPQRHQLQRVVYRDAIETSAPAETFVANPLLAYWNTELLKLKELNFIHLLQSDLKHNLKLHVGFIALVLLIGAVAHAIMGFIFFILVKPLWVLMLVLFLGLRKHGHKKGIFRSNASASDLAYLN